MSDKRKSDTPDDFPGKKPKLDSLTTVCCSICLDEKNKQSGFFCPNNDCQVWTCLKPCFDTLMKGEFAMACATCHTEIDRPQWWRLFPAGFITERMNQKWGTVLYAKEQAKLSTYQTFATNEKEARAIEQEIFEEDAKLKPLKEQAKELQARIKQMETARAALKRQADGLRTLPIQLQPQAAAVVLTEEGEVELEPSFSTHCLTPECNGFMDRNMFCSLCDKTYCGQCHSDEHPDTPCDADKLATILLVQQNTKPCPKCGTTISKVSGCYQMWCPYLGCGTFFDWGTGRELKNPRFRHNPEYTEALRNGGLIFQQGENGACVEGTPSLHALLGAHLRRLSLASTLGDPRYDAITAFHRSHNHLSDPANDYGLNTEEKHRNSGINFLLKRSTGDKPYDIKEYQSDLRRIAKEDYYLQEIRGVLRTCVAAGRDIFRNYIVNGLIDELYRQCCVLAEITNKEIFATCERYGGLKPKGLFAMNKARLVFLSYLPPNDADKDVRPAKRPLVRPASPLVRPVSPLNRPMSPLYRPTSPSYSPTSPLYSPTSPL